MRPQFLNGSPLLNMMNAVARALTPESLEQQEIQLPEKVEPTQTRQSPSGRAPE